MKSEIAFVGFHHEGPLKPRNGLLAYDDSAGFNTAVGAVDGMKAQAFALEGASFYGFIYERTRTPEEIKYQTEAGIKHLGGAVITTKNGQHVLFNGMWFCSNDYVNVQSGANSTVMVICIDKFKCIPQFGGPIEEKGRLKYIDLCSDTLLIAPPRQGDPCLNHLHFPSGIDQTKHTHPSVRMGMVVAGLGNCHADGQDIPLKPGTVFCIATDGEHKFSTLNGQSMDVIAFHPDSDWGPTDEIHPMINRTLVEGVKIDNSQGVHTQAETIKGRA